MFPEKLLNEREAAVLRALVYEYIISGKPVGSRSFVQKYSFTISPATMRNIMADLEILGYLSQPHTSAGRIPTDKGYRFYVDYLLDKYNHSFSGEIEVRDDVVGRELQLEKVFFSITRMLSNMSHYAGVMLTPKLDFTVVKRIELIPLDTSEVLVVLVTRTGMVINRKVTLSVGVTQDDLYEFSKFLTAELSGYSLHDIKEKIFCQLRSLKLEGLNRELALDIAQLALNVDEESELHVDGIENLLKIPEMIEEERLKSLLNIIEEKNILRRILEAEMPDEGIKTLIGSEIEEARVAGCSMVTSTYRIGNANVGILGVLGPTRMDYEKVVPLVDYTGRAVSTLLTNMSK